MSRYAYAKVDSTSPLKITTDADPAHPLPALCLSSYTPVAGDRVRVEIRQSGLLPIVQSKVA